MNKKLIIYSILIFFTLSPSLSISYFLIGIYIPNHFIIIPVVGSFLLSRSFAKKSFYFIVFWALFYLLVLCLRFSYLENAILYSSDITFLIISISVFIIISSKEIDVSIFTQSFKVVIFLFCFWALCQNIFLNYGLSSYLYIFITHPDQLSSNYYFPVWIDPFYRVPGFMLEASQFSFLISFYVIWSLIKSKFVWQDIFPLAMIVVNGSTTGYLFFAIIMLMAIMNIIIKLFIYFRTNWKNLLLTILTFMSLVIILWNAKDQVKKILDTIQFINSGLLPVNMDSLERVYNFSRELKNISGMSEIFLGRGLSHVFGYDLYSVSIKGLGLVIFFSFNILLFFKLTKDYKFLLLCLLSFGISAGSLLEAATVFIIIYLGITRVNNVK